MKLIRLMTNISALSFCIAAMFSCERRDDALESSLAAKSLPTCPQNSELESKALFYESEVKKCHDDLRGCSAIAKPLPAPTCIPVEQTSMQNDFGMLTPRAWAENWESISSKKVFRPGGAAGIFSYVVIKKQGEKFSIIPQNSTVPNPRIFLSSPSSEDINSVLDTNKSIDPETGDEVDQCVSSVEQIFECFEVDSVVDVSDKVWTIVVFNKAILKTNTIVASPGGDELNVPSWLRNQLGYDAIVLDVRGRNVLAQLPGTAEVGEGAQAFSWKASQAKYAVDSTSRSTGGLLQLVSKEGKYAIFKIPVRNTPASEFQPGTKVRLWSRNSEATLAH
jgi:hypothetical protein